MVTVLCQGVFMGSVFTRALRVFACALRVCQCVLSVEAGLALICSPAQTSPRAAGLHPPTLDATMTWSGSDNHLAVVPPVFTPLFLLSSYKSTF